MTKGKTTEPKRTRALDRDGDGHDGGSLLGNQTAPMTTPAPKTAPPEAATPPETAAASAEAPPETAPVETDLFGGPEEAAEVDAALAEGATMADGRAIADEETASEPEPWARDDATILLKLGEKWIEIDPSQPAALTEEVVKDWSDYDAQLAEAWADAMNAPDMITGEDGDWLRADLSLIETPEILVPFVFAPERSDEPDPSEPTFTAEEAAAGQTPIVEQEGESQAVAADVDTVIPDEDPLAVIETATAPVAVRVRELQILVDSRRLYHGKDGYHSNYGPPYIAADTVKAWVAAGLAEDVPSMGNTGGVRALAAAHAALREARAEAG